jgi:hypothetical protein
MLMPQNDLVFSPGGLHAGIPEHAFADGSVAFFTGFMVSLVAAPECDDPPDFGVFDVLDEVSLFELGRGMLNSIPEGNFKNIPFIRGDMSFKNRDQHCAPSVLSLSDYEREKNWSDRIIAYFQVN